MSDVPDKRAVPITQPTNIGGKAETVRVTSDVSHLSAREALDMIDKCNFRLEALREQARAEAEALGLVCSLPNGKAKKRRGSKHSATE